MNIADVYQSTMNAMARGERALVRLSPPDVSELIAALRGSQRREALILIAQASHADLQFEPALLVLTQSALSDEEQVWLLNALSKHIITGRGMKGDRLPVELIEHLRRLLKSKDARVVEWALRTVDECGPQGIVLKKDIQKLRPSVWSLWRAQNRTILELVTYLERKWGP